jgi:hypothetical protein
MGLVVVWDYRWLLVKGAQDATSLVTLLINALGFLRLGCAPRDIDTAHSTRYRYRELRSAVPISCAALDTNTVAPHR